MKVELADICFNPGKEDFFAKIEVNVKSLLTRNYNKRHFEAKEKRKKIQITDNDREVVIISIYLRRIIIIQKSEKRLH